MSQDVILQQPVASLGSERPATLGPSLLELSPELVVHIARYLPDQELLGVCKALRAVCLANATTATLVSGYDGASNDAHVATMARCPRLTDVNAERLGAADAPWPLAAVTRLTSLAIGGVPLWSAAHIPTSLRELKIALDVDPDDYSYLPEQLLADLRSRSCSIHINGMAYCGEDLAPLAEPWMADRVRVHTLILEESFAPVARQLVGSVLSELTSLTLMRCNDTSLDCLASLRHLQLLHLEDCAEVASLPALPLSLAALHLVNCQALTELDPALASLAQLRELTIERCSNLDAASVATMLPGLRKAYLACTSVDQVHTLCACAALTHLDLDCYGCVPSDTDLCQLPSLRMLYIRDAPELVDFSRLHIPAQLTFLSMWKCPRLESLTNLSHLSALEALALHDCNALRSLAGLPFSLPLLTSLHIVECNALESLAALPPIPQLRKLNLRNCAALAGECDSLSALTAVTSLALWPGSAMTGLQLRAVEGCLHDLHLHDCDKPVFSELGCMRHLRSLSICGRPTGGLAGFLASDELLDFTALNPSVAPQLATLNLFDLDGLTSLRGLEAAPCLETLSIVSCGALRSLQGLESNTRLRNVHLEYCLALTSLQGLPPCAPGGQLCVEQCYSLDVFSDCWAALDALES